MIISTLDQIPNQEISEILGIARGSTVRAKNVGKDILHYLKILLVEKFMNILNFKLIREKRLYKE